MTPVDPKMAEKIQSILRKADEDKNSSEAEREIAIRKANEMLLKHGLSMADIETAAEDIDGRKHRNDKAFTTESDTDYWKGMLLYRMAPIYFCKVYYTRLGGGKKRSQWLTLGRADYVTTLMQMFEFVMPQVQLEFDILAKRMTLYHRFARRYGYHALRDIGADILNPEEWNDELAAEAGKDRYEEIRMDEGSDAAAEDVQTLLSLDSRQYAKNAQRFIRKGEIAPSDTDNLGVWRRSFFEGAIARIGTRLSELMAEAQEDVGHSTSQALVKNEKLDLDKFIESLGLRLRTGYVNRKSDRRGHEAGTDVGDRTDLSRHSKVGTSTRQLPSG